MCGIAGQFGAARPPEAATLKAMADALAHRGPDDSGLWIDAQAGIGFAHRRLAVLDLSAAGHQPMLSHSGRLVIAFNGEIYNHLELRKQLGEQLGEQRWRGHSDTETLLVAFERWGVAATLVRLSGMFAIALWDRSNRHLILARDRLGEKPLYYGWQGKDFLFASELHAIRRHPSFLNQIDRNALSQHLRFSMIPAPWSIFRGIQKLPPGHWLEIDCSGAIGVAAQAQPLPYWSIIDIALAGQRNPFKGSDADAIEALDQHLLRSVRQQALEALEMHNISTTLVVTLKNGVNDGEVADIVRHALEWRCVRGVTLQPIQDAGRNDGFDPKAHRVLLSDVRREVAKAGIFALEDMIPLPCNPEAISIGYGLRDGKSVAPITSLIPREVLVEATPNTETFEAYPELRRRMFDLLSLSTAAADTSDKLAAVLCCLPQAAVPQHIGYEHTFRVVIVQFMDRFNFDLGGVKRSCVHFVEPDGKIYPFDTFNTFYREGAAGRAALGRVPS